MPIQLMSEDDRITVTDAELVAGGDAETTYELRPLTRDVYKRVAKAHTKSAPNRAIRQMEDKVDMVAVHEDLLDHALVAWSGILWNGAPAPCDRSFKLKLDGLRVSSLLERAGMSQIVAAEAGRQDSFR